ncbi:MAG: hypothetical protein PHG02_02790 [Oscillospiraceae bacterium]|nr:hypothetical protein [Oscillospiraceae bacterium]
MRKSFTALKGRRLVAACYLVFIVASIVLCLYNFTYDSILRATGKLQTVYLTTADFTEIDQIEIVDKTTLLTVENEFGGGDPKIILDYSKTPVYVRSITTDMRFSRAPGEFNVFYLTKKAFALGHTYGTSDRVWGAQDKSGVWHFTLPRTQYYGLRIDPGTFTANQISWSYIILNAPRSFFSYFTFGYSWLFGLIVYPALAAAIIGWLQEIYTHYIKKRTV